MERKNICTGITYGERQLGLTWPCKSDGAPQSTCVGGQSVAVDLDRCP